METGFDQIRRNWRWLGRKWLAGALVGWWLGVLTGAAITIGFKLEQNWTIFHFLGLLLIGMVVSMASSAIAGKPEASPSAQEQP